jgi:hypothetical protein
MRKVFAGIVYLFCVLLAASLPVLSSSAQDYGVAAKKPIIGGACPGCPWGALADKVKAAMKPLGYDVQVCYNCSGIQCLVRTESKEQSPLPAIAG